MNIFKLMISAMCSLFLLTGCTSENEESGAAVKRFTSYEVKEIYADGDIYGKAYIPESDNAVPLIIFAHELGSDHRSGEDYAEYYAERGIAVYTFDFRNGGYGSKSGNDMSEMSVATERDDLNAVVNEVKKWDLVDPDRIVLLGASQGGFVSTMYALEEPDSIAGLMCIYPAYLIRDDIHETFDGSLDNVPDTFSYKGWFTAGRLYAEDVWDYDIYEGMSSFEKPVLILHGDRDSIVPQSYAEKAAEEFPNAELHIIKGAGHGFYGSSFDTAVRYMNSYLQSIGIMEVSE